MTTPAATAALAALLHDNAVACERHYGVDNTPAMLRVVHETHAARLTAAGVTLAQPCLDCDMNPGCCDRHDIAQPAGLDVERLARALSTDAVRRYVSEAWVDSGVSEAGYATVDEMAAAIAAAYGPAPEENR